MPVGPVCVNSSQERPRIDVGFDDSGFYPILSNYLVGIVWHTIEFLEGGETRANVMLCGFPAGGFPMFPAVALTPAPDFENYTYNVFPTIEVEPIENGSYRTTFVTWTGAEEEDPGEYDKTLLAVNTFSLCQYYPGGPYAVSFYH